MKKNIDIVIPVKNEEKNVAELSKQIHAAFSQTDVDYNMIFVVDLSTDNTIKILRELSEIYPITIHKKEGKPGKGYSIIEGTQLADADIVAFIDGDLQYPPEIIPQMLEMLIAEELGVVVANRKTHKSPFLRKFGSKVNRLLFGKLILGLDCDVQSGLKVFRKEIFHHVDLNDIGPWTVDMPLLHTATELGHKIGQVDISFEDRKGGQSKVSFIKTGWTIAKCAINLKLKEKRVYHHDKDIDQTNDTPINKGITYKRNKFVPHTFLPYHKTSLYTFHKWQKTAIGLGIALFTGSLFINPIFTGVTTVAILSTIYFADVVFTLFLTIKSLNKPPEIKITEWELKNLDNHSLPVYSVMCPLYKEAEVLGHFIENIQKMDWPKDKLDVMLLLEENDLETQEAAANMEMPSYVRVLVVPNSQPKTKPKACNYGLHHAYGEYVVIYDAEDKPDPQQLKKAYLAFNKVPKNVLCIQGKLNYYNPHQNLLTTLFTAEYSLWFDIILPGLQSIYTTIPLGGTSNHFRTKELIRLHAWDPFNVTEDCDLGVRLFKDGFKTAIIDSTTWEEANSNVKNWIRQRSRWIKGYFQTYLVHMRNPIEFFKQHKWHALIFQLIIGLRISFILINPILWVSTISYFVFYDYVGLTIESLYPSIVFYMAAFSLVFGNFLYLYNYMIGLAKKEHWGVIKYVFFVPFYWMLMSIAAVMAFWQLLVKPHYWEKTKHGLHISNKKEKISVFDKVQAIPLTSKLNLSPAVLSGGVLIASTFIANFANFVYNAYLGREVELSQFGTVSLISNIFAVSTVFASSLGKVTAYKTAYLFGRSKTLNKSFYSHIKKFTWFFSLITTIAWVVSTPLLARFFNESDIMPFLLFTPYWMISFVGSVNSGFLSGSHKFEVLGISMLVEAVSKVVLAVLIVETGITQLIYGVIPIAILLSFVFESLIIYKTRAENIEIEDSKSFPTGFYLTSIFTKISTVVFLSADVILAKHFLNPIDAGKYALLSLAGKIVYFLGNMLSQFIIPIVSKEEGLKAKSEKKFYKLLIGSSVLSLGGFAGIGLLGYITVPILFGEKTLSIVQFLPQYTLAMLAFSVSSGFVAYHQVKKHYSFAIVPLIFSVVEIVLIAISAASIFSFVNIIVVLSYIQLGSILLIHAFYPHIKYILSDLIELIVNGTIQYKAKTDESKTNILIFNWRDNKHTWAGGAEVYLHEIAKRWIKEGHNVYVFCGNDRKNKRNETIDGVTIIRRGGFYTVYLWAAVYYIFRLRKHIDIVIDSENGIPFFTPFFVKKPIILLIHHVHKDIVVKALKLPKYLIPIAFIAKSLESKLMPAIYKNSNVVAVSESTKEDLHKLGFSKNISVINPGVDINKFRRDEKSEVPTVLYLGRIKHYKSLDTLIKAHELVLQKVPNAKLLIAGFGEARKQLENLINEIGLEDNIQFLGKVSEDEKVDLMSKSWVFVYPSTMEGWGISVIEASACGTAVVASNVPGLRDSVKSSSTGFLVEKGNVKEFADAITKILTSKTLRTKIENEGVKWAGNFTWEISAEKFLKIFNNLDKSDAIENTAAFALEGN